MGRFVVFFAHFYQPPRFNPWIEFVDLDPWASPFHDWNERVALECYTRLPRAPLYDQEGWVSGVVNLYSRLAFSFGPVLLEWLRARHPRVFSAVVEADKESISREGRGNAIAQPYAHIIMPLADRRYKELAVGWGIRFFERTFERYPEGFWLPEAAVDSETLEVLADHGIEFVVLAPHQIREVYAGDKWASVGVADPRRAYEVELPSGRSIRAVVYNHALSQEVAFGNLLDSEEQLASRILGSFDEKLGEPQLVSIATDGETYGHHKKRGVEGLAKAISALESSGRARVSNYSAFLSASPTRLRARIAERTSWSCPHGVERWRANCGCASEIRPGWTQEWRAPLRRAIDWLSQEVLKAFDAIAPSLFKDGWKAALEYGGVFYGRSLDAVSKFLGEGLSNPADEGARIRALKILEALRNALLAQSSDAWFFEDLYRPEPYQVLRHSARALELLEGLGVGGLVDSFKGLLREAVGNTGVRGDELFDQAVKSRIDPKRAVAAYAIRSSVGAGGGYRIYIYRVSRLRGDRVEVEGGYAELGVVEVLSEVTMERAALYYVLANLGGLDLYVGVGYLGGMEEYEKILGAVRSRQELRSGPVLVSMISSLFKEGTYGLADLPVDDRLEVLRSLLPGFRSSIREFLSQRRGDVASLLRLLRATGGRIPDYLQHYMIASLSIEFEESLDKLDVGGLIEVLRSMRDLGLPITPNIAELIPTKLLELVESLRPDPSDTAKLELALSMAKLLEGLGASEVYIEHIRSAIAEARDRYLAYMAMKAKSGDEAAAKWVELFKNLASTMKVRT